MKKIELELPPEGCLRMDVINSNGKVVGVDMTEAVIGSDSDLQVAFETIKRYLPKLLK